MKTLVRPLGAAAVALVLFAGGAATAQAYNLQGPRLSTSSPTFKIDGGSSASKTAWTSGISDWNNASAGVSLSTTSGSGTATLGDANDSSVSWDGITYYSWDNNNIVTDVSAYLNVAYTGNYDSTKRKGVAAHEIGHVLGLDHTNSCVLMNPTTPARTNCGVSTPQSDDINGVSSLYASNGVSNREFTPGTTSGNMVMHLSQAQSFKDLKSLHQGADAVVLASVGAKSEAVKNGIPFTDHQLKVQRWLKGGSADGSATIHQTGGTLNGALLQDELDPLLQEGQLGLYFLHQYAPGKFFIIGGADGRFNVSASSGIASPASATVKGVTSSLASLIAQTQALTAAKK